jgi:hypothetical protein
LLRRFVSHPSRLISRCFGRPGPSHEQAPVVEDALEAVHDHAAVPAGQLDRHERLVQPQPGEERALGDEVMVDPAAPLRDLLARPVVDPDERVERRLGHLRRHVVVGVLRGVPREDVLAGAADGARSIPASIASRSTSPRSCACRHSSAVRRSGIHSVHSGSFGW